MDGYRIGATRFTESRLQTDSLSPQSFNNHLGGTTLLIALVQALRVASGLSERAIVHRTSDLARCQSLVLESGRLSRRQIHAEYQRDTRQPRASLIHQQPARHSHSHPDQTIRHPQKGEFGNRLLTHIFTMPYVERVVASEPDSSQGWPAHYGKKL